MHLQHANACSEVSTQDMHADCHLLVHVGAFCSDLGCAAESCAKRRSIGQAKGLVQYWAEPYHYMQLSRGQRAGLTPLAHALPVSPGLRGLLTDFALPGGLCRLVQAEPSTQRHSTARTPANALCLVRFYKARNTTMLQRRCRVILNLLLRRRAAREPCTMQTLAPLQCPRLQRFQSKPQVWLSG